MIDTKIDHARTASMKQLLGFCLFIFIYSQGWAQFYPTRYRPPNLHWQQLKTPHFRIVFPLGEDSVAWRSGRILESEYKEVQELADGSLSGFPIVLNNFNDRSNGYVTALHFRSEIEIPPIKGKSLNPRSGNWLEAVEPHELVHALHFSNTGGFGIGGLVSLFSPDLARSLHGAIPSGITEGLATYYETKSVLPGGGRGNHPYFYNQFNTVFESPQRWNMGQLVHFPERTRPFDRHYIGGYEFTDWLQETYGGGTSRDALNFYIDLPFLGYGIALWQATGKWPASLYTEFTQDKSRELGTQERNGQNISALPIPFKGAAIRRPKWLDNQTLLFYGSFYNNRPGFFSYDLKSNVLHRFNTTNAVGDYIYDLSDDRTKLVYSYFRSSPVYDQTFYAELAELDLEKKESRSISTKGRMYAPVLQGDRILALQTYHASSRLVEFNKNTRDTQILANLGEHQMIEAAIHPENANRLAVIINKRGMQGLWIANRATIQQDLEGAPAVAFSEGSIYDISWHPSEDRILLTSDHTGTMNIYEYDLAKDRLHQLTESAFNAFEAEYSPDGNRIAFILQKKNEQLPAVLYKQQYLDLVIAPDLWKPNADKAAFMERPELGHTIDTEKQGWEQSSYYPGLSWLKPRAVIPVIDEVSNSGNYRIGAILHSNNLLQNQSYTLELSGFEERLWYDLSYTNKTFVPGFRASAYSEPSLRTLGFTTEQDTTFRRLIRQEQSVALAIPFRYNFDRNIYLTSIALEPEIRRSGIRYLNMDGGAASNFGNFTIGNIFSAFNYRLQQNIRDVQPNSGITIFGEVEHYFSANDIRFTFGDQQFQRSPVRPTGLRGGIYTYLAPLSKWNQSLRLGLTGITQTDAVFDNQSLVSGGFSEEVFPASNNMLSFSARYTIPLVYPDDGGFLLPFYLSNVYLVGFSNTVADASGGEPISSNRTVIGAGLRMQFRISNLALDLGVGIGFEPSRGISNVFIGNF